MSIWLADVNGRVVKSIVERNFNLFCKRVSKIASQILFTDILIDALLHPLVGGEFGHGVFFQAALSGFP
jgi:hypothetical protein